MCSSDCIESFLREEVTVTSLTEPLPFFRRDDFSDLRRKRIRPALLIELSKNLTYLDGTGTGTGTEDKSRVGTGTGTGRGRETEGKSGTGRGLGQEEAGKRRIKAGQDGDWETEDRDGRGLGMQNLVPALQQ